VCVEVAHDDGGYEVFRVVIEEVLEVVSHGGNSMICIDQSGDDLVILFDIDDNRVGVHEGVIENIVNDV
jgi:hypothetical protein